MSGGPLRKLIRDAGHGSAFSLAVRPQRTTSGGNPFGNSPVPPASSICFLELPDIIETCNPHLTHHRDPFLRQREHFHHPGLGNQPRPIRRSLSTSSRSSVSPRESTDVRGRWDYRGGRQLPLSAFQGIQSEQFPISNRPIVLPGLDTSNRMSRHDNVNPIFRDIRNGVTPSFHSPSTLPQQYNSVPQQYNSHPSHITSPRGDSRRIVNKGNGAALRKHRSLGSVKQVQVDMFPKNGKNGGHFADQRDYSNGPGRRDAYDDTDIENELFGTHAEFSSSGRGDTLLHGILRGRYSPEDVEFVFNLYKNNDKGGKRGRAVGPKTNVVSKLPEFCFFMAG